MIEYCAVIGKHSTVRGDKLLNDHVPDLFPWCGIQSKRVQDETSLVKPDPRACGRSGIKPIRICSTATMSAVPILIAE